MNKGHSDRSGKCFFFHFGLKKILNADLEIGLLCLVSAHILVVFPSVSLSKQAPTVEKLLIVL